MDNDDFYTELAVDLGRVLTTGPRAETMLNALADPWEDEEDLVPPTLQAPAQRPANMGDWIEANEEAARKPFQPYWDEIIGRVKAREFTTQKQLAATYRKPATWASQFKTIALKQKALTREEWDASFTGSTGNRAEKKKPTNTHNEKEKTEHGQL